ncbi:hypothetical protein I3843_03G108600 [Carya illinoinensis]|nr:hypothetical protein I3843_03G108600 [Carya illinoinensis]
MIMAAQNNALLEEITGSSFGSASSSSTDPITKESTFLVKGKFRIVDFHQSFHYTSCENCNEVIGYEHGENFLCYSCKNMTIVQPRCLIYLDVCDDSTSILLVIFGSSAEQILGCTTIDLIEHTGEEQRRMSFQTFLFKLSTVIIYKYKVLVYNCNYVYGSFVL